MCGLAESCQLTANSLQPNRPAVLMALLDTLRRGVGSLFLANDLVKFIRELSDASALGWRSIPASCSPRWRSRCGDRTAAHPRTAAHSTQNLSTRSARRRLDPR